MTKTEMDIRSVLGPAGGSIRPLAAASDLFARRMFEERMDSEDIFLTKDIYPIVAAEETRRHRQSHRAAGRPLLGFGRPGPAERDCGEKSPGTAGPPGHYDLLCLVFSQGDSLF